VKLTTEGGQTASIAVEESTPRSKAVERCLIWVELQFPRQIRGPSGEQTNFMTRGIKDQG